MIIAIDGPAASGKSTTAKEVARRLGWLYLDSGAMYRAVTLACVRAGTDLNDPDAILSEGLKHQVDQQTLDGVTHTYLDGEDVSGAIRMPDVTRLIKPVADHPGIRGYLVRQQRRIGEDANAVVDGRDIGTVVFPQAELKIFMIASKEERARRRYRELQSKGVAADMAELERDIADRDHADMSRPVGALKKADDAVELDSTSLSIEEQIKRIIELWEQRQPA